jgi:hypothetical protein
LTDSLVQWPELKMLAVLHLPLSPAVENSLFELNRLTMQHGSKVIGSLESWFDFDETSENGEETFGCQRCCYLPTTQPHTGRTVV